MSETKPIQPLSQEEMAKQQTEHGHITGKVELELKQIINSNLEDFLDLLSYGLTNSYCLSDINYTIVGHTATTIIFEVTGDADGCIDD